MKMIDLVIANYPEWPNPRVDKIFQDYDGELRCYSYDENSVKTEQHTYDRYPKNLIIAEETQAAMDKYKAYAVGEEDGGTCVTEMEYHRARVSKTANNFMKFVISP